MAVQVTDVAGNQAACLAGDARGIKKTEYINSIFIIFLSFLHFLAFCFLKKGMLFKHLSYLIFLKKIQKKHFVGIYFQKTIFFPPAATTSPTALTEAEHTLTEKKKAASPP